MTNQMLFDDVDMGPYRPPSSYPIHRQGDREDVAGVVVVDFETLEKNL